MARELKNFDDFDHYVCLRNPNTGEVYPIQKVVEIIGDDHPDGTKRCIFIYRQSDNDTILQILIPFDNQSYVGTYIYLFMDKIKKEPNDAYNDILIPLIDYIGFPLTYGSLHDNIQITSLDNKIQANFTDNKIQNNSLRSFCHYIELYSPGYTRC
jgi:hypothetical protein